MPEVSLVAIFDADKEGFLRSERALIQTIGRAARHLNGAAILYADRLTPSMQRAIDETDRRRIKQMTYNLEHGITPVGITRAITDILEAGRSDKEILRKTRMIPLPEMTLSVKELIKHIKRIEERMYEHARNLEFEEAAALRNEVQRLRSSLPLAS